MKKIFAIILVMTSSFTFAQSLFQGTIKYDFVFTGEGVEDNQAFLPTRMNISVLKSDVLTEVVGGMFDMGRTLTKTKTGISYLIKDSEQMIYVIDPAKMNVEETVTELDPQVTKENETLTLAGYQCEKYSVVTTTDGVETIAFVWVTNKIQIPKSATDDSEVGMSGMLNMKGVPGTPLKTMTSELGVVLIITATDVSTSKPDKNIFKLPKGYKKEDYDEN